MKRVKKVLGRVFNLELVAVLVGRLVKEVIRSWKR